MRDYIATIYADEERPKTAYPSQLAAWLTRRFGMTPGMALLEIGCGRCEFLRGFAMQGLHCCGVDISPHAAACAPELKIDVCNIEKEALPFADSTFDVVYSKSLLEHCQQPEHYFQEAARVLRPGGLCLTLVPDWESNYKIYFDDYTHRTPFTRVSLRDIYRMAGLEAVHVERFRQLPQTWGGGAAYLWRAVSRCIAPLVPVRTKSTFLRWSRELMLLGVGRKPNICQ